MIEVIDKVMDAWMDLIDGSISVPVYKEGCVPEEEEGNYVELRAESEAEDDTKSSFRSDVFIVVDIVTSFVHAIDKSVSAVIDNEIKQLIKTTPGIHNLPDQPQIQILNVVPETTTYRTEYDTKKKYYRKIVRYGHRIIQQ
jgi:hypothetical protein